MNYRKEDIMRLKGVSANVKQVLWLIFSMDANGGCYAGNEYIANDLGIHISTVSKIISKLKTAEVIELGYFDGRRRILKPTENANADLAYCQCRLGGMVGQSSKNANADLAYCQPSIYNVLSIDNLITDTIVDNLREEAVENVSTTYKPEERPEPIQTSTANNPPKEKKERKNSAQKKEMEVVWPWLSDDFVRAWNLWEQYRAERRLPKYAMIGQQAAFKKLADISGGDASIAIQIIHESISNNWQGLFPLKFQNKNQSNGRKQFSKDKLAEALREAFPNAA